MTPVESLQRDGASVVAFPKQWPVVGSHAAASVPSVREALRGFSESPSTENAVRYLAASRELRPSPRRSDLPPAA
jgi:hypothetical protein